MYSRPSSRVGCRMLRREEPRSSQSPVSVRVEEVRPAVDITLKDPRVRWALKLLQQGYSVSDNDIAKNLNLSSSRFRHLFKRELGVSRREYQKRIQLSRARKLLTSTFLSVKEIAHTCLWVGITPWALFGRTTTKA